MQLRLNLSRVQRKAEHAVLLTELSIQRYRVQDVGRFADAICAEGDIRRVVLDRQTRLLQHPDIRLLVIGNILVGCLPLQIRESDGRDERREAGHVHDALVRAGEDLGHDEVGEEEVSDVVCREVHFDAVGAESPRLDIHDARVVNYDVDGGDIGPARYLCSGRADGGQGAEVEGEGLDSYRGVCAAERGEALLEFGFGAPGDDDCGG